MWAGYELFLQSSVWILGDCTVHGYHAFAAPWFFSGQLNTKWPKILSKVSINLTHLWYVMLQAPTKAQLSTIIALSNPANTKVHGSLISWFLQFLDAQPTSTARTSGLAPASMPFYTNVTVLTCTEEDSYYKLMLLRHWWIVLSF